MGRFGLIGLQNTAGRGWRLLHVKVSEQLQPRSLILVQGPQFAVRLLTQCLIYLLVAQEAALTPGP